MTTYACDVLRHKHEPVVNARQIEKLKRRNLWILFSIYSAFLFFISNDLESKDKMPNKVPRKPIKNILKENTNMRMGANTDLMVSFVFSYTS